MAVEYVIVGSGVAGIAAAESLRTRVPGASITLVTEDPAGFYSRPGLAYYLSGIVPKDQLFPRSPAELRALGLAWIDGRVTQILPREHRLELADGRKLAYDRLLLATGTHAIPPDFPGGEVTGVFMLDTLHDANQLIRAARRGVTAVVVGGGITALELVEGLVARGCQVHYLMRGARYWANMLDAEESQLVEERLRAHGVELHPHTRIRQAHGVRGKLSFIETDAGAKLPCTLLAVAIGTRPRLELAQQAGIATDRGILANEYLQTNVADIFAAGDVAQVRDPRTGKATLDTLWPTARAHGMAAALTMAGTLTPYQRSVSTNVTLLAGIPTTMVGAVGSGSDTDLMAIARGDSETWLDTPAQWVVVERHDVSRMRLMLGDTNLRGALVMGDQTLVDPVRELINANVDITAIRNELLAPNTDIRSLIYSFWRDWEAKNGTGR